MIWKLTGLRKTFRARDGLGRMQTRLGLNGVDLELGAGERVALIGESGSGKTTLSRAGLGLSPIDAGKIELFGQDATRWSRRRWMSARRDVQLLYQDPRATLHPQIPLGLLLLDSARLHQPEADPHGAVAAILHDVGLADREEALPHELSGGERRRASLARVLLARPRLLVADEPTTGLDAQLRVSLIRLLLDRAGPGCAVLLISHDLPAVAWACQRIVVLDAGRVVDRFPVEALHHPHTRPWHPKTAALLGAAGLVVEPS